MNELNNYIKELSAALNCPSSLKHRLLLQTRRMAEDFREGKPDASWEEVRDYLGNPEELAQTMLECENQDALKCYQKRKKKQTQVLVAVFLLTLILVSFALIYIYWSRSNPVIIDVKEQVIIQGDLSFVENSYEEES